MDICLFLDIYPESSSKFRECSHLTGLVGSWKCQIFIFPASLQLKRRHLTWGENSYPTEVEHTTTQVAEAAGRQPPPATALLRRPHTSSGVKQGPQWTRPLAAVLETVEPPCSCLFSKPDSVVFWAFCKLANSLLSTACFKSLFDSTSKSYFIWLQ